jgi:hypothetical protein
MTEHLHIPADELAAKLTQWFEETLTYDNFREWDDERFGDELHAFLRGLSVEPTVGLAEVPRYISDELRWIANSGRAKPTVAPHLCTIADVLDARPLADAVAPARDGNT